MKRAGLENRSCLKMATVGSNPTPTFHKGAQMLVEKYLRQHSVLDGQGNMDGAFVPLSVAMRAVQKALDGYLEMAPPSWICDSIWEGLSTGTREAMLLRQEALKDS